MSSWPRLYTINKEHLFTFVSFSSLALIIPLPGLVQTSVEIHIPCFPLFILSLSLSILLVSSCELWCVCVDTIAQSVIITIWFVLSWKPLTHILQYNITVHLVRVCHVIPSRSMLIGPLKCEKCFTLVFASTLEKILVENILSQMSC